MFCRRYAWGQDELDAVHQTGVEWFNVGLTIVDGLDTLLIMGLVDEAKEARQWIANHLVLQGKSVSVGIAQYIVYAAFS
jgi:endoplasmic reticulum Man9GlcNAc2 1,2-alpha-mannosidase